MSQKESESRGVSRSRFQGIKQRIRENGDLNLNTPTVKMLLCQGKGKRLKSPSLAAHRQSFNMVLIMVGLIETIRFPAEIFSWIM